MNTIATIFKSMNTPDGKPTKEMLERWATLMEDIIMDDRKGCCELNYEAMYHELCEKHAKLEEENKYLNANLKESMEQCHIMRAQLDMVHLIFGRNN